MNTLTQKGSENGKGTTNGDARRRLESWIESFVEYTDNLETPEIYRRWVGIITLGAVLEQRVFMGVAGPPLFPNLYGILVGPPGIGKSRSIRAARDLVKQLEGFNLAPDSVTGASLTDALQESKRSILRYNGAENDLVFHSMYLMPDEFSDFMKDYDNALVGKLTKFWDCDSYIETRSTNKVKRQVTDGQLSMIGGVTTSHMLEVLPDHVWDQGLMARTVLIFGDDHEVQEDYFSAPIKQSEDLVHDLKSIFTLQGQFELSDDYRGAFNDWRRRDFAPRPAHPRLVHYNTRRGTQVLKLSMVSCADRGETLRIDLHDLERAKSWLLGAESHMGRIFGGQLHADAKAVDDLLHDMGAGEVPENKLLRLAIAKVGFKGAKQLVQMMEETGLIKEVQKKGARIKHYVRA